MKHESMLGLLRAFAAEHGVARLGHDTIYANVKLGGWARRRRGEYRQGRLADWLAEAFEQVPGWSWEPVATRTALKIAALRDFVAQNGWDRLAMNQASAVPWRGFNLTSFVDVCRSSHRRGRLATSLTKQLEAVPGWEWAPRSRIAEHRLALLKAYLARHRWSRLVLALGKRIVVDGIDLRRWLYTCRFQHRKGLLAPWLTRELSELPGWSWTPKPSLVGAPPLLLRQRLAALRDHVRRVGWVGLEGDKTSGVRRRGVDLAQWVTECRHRHREGLLPGWLEAELESIGGWSWLATRSPHAEEIALCRELVRAFGTEGSNVVRELVAMARFVDLASAARQAGSLEAAVIKRLEQVPGWSWRKHPR